jgi:hypothetical protein
MSAAGLGVVTLCQDRPGRRAAWFLLIYWLVPLSATWLSAQSRPIFNERYLVAAVPPLYLLMAAAASPLGASQRPWLGWAGRGVVLLLLLGMGNGVIRQQSDPLYSKTRGWRELAATMEPLPSSIDPQRVRFVQNYPDPTLWYYYSGDVPHLVLPPRAHDQSLADEEVSRLAAEGVEWIVLIEQPAASWDPGGIAASALAAEYRLGGATTVARWPLSFWIRPATELEAMPVSYERGLQLAGARIRPTEVLPGGLLEVQLRWQGSEEVVDEHEAVSVQLLNAHGTLVAQTDRPLPIASGATTQVESYGILLPMTLPAGEYQVAVVVYDPEGAGLPRRLTLQGSDSVVLGAITVENSVEH